MNISTHKRVKIRSLIITISTYVCVSEVYPSLANDSVKTVSNISPCEQTSSNQRSILFHRASLRNEERKILFIDTHNFPDPIVGRDEGESSIDDRWWSRFRQWPGK